jgi:hypothetical protein
LETMLLTFLVCSVIGLLGAVRGLERRLRHLQADHARLTHQLGLTLGTDPSSEVRELARDPKRYIDAIRLYREQSGQELREAKAVIDAIAAKRD